MTDSNQTNEYLTGWVPITKSVYLYLLTDAAYGKQVGQIQVLKQNKQFWPFGCSPVATVPSTELFKTLDSLLPEPLEPAEKLRISNRLRDRWRYYRRQEKQWIRDINRPTGEIEAR